MANIEVDKETQKQLTDVTYFIQDDSKIVQNALKKLHKSFIPNPQGLKFIEQQNM